MKAVVIALFAVLAVAAASPTKDLQGSEAVYVASPYVASYPAAAVPAAYSAYSYSYPAVSTYGAYAAAPYAYLYR